MLNHIYGVAGLAGVLVTIVTSYLKNDDSSRWVLVISGWVACLIVALVTALGTRRLTKHLIEQQKNYEDTLVNIGELKNQIDELRGERDTAQAISAFLVKNEYGKSAKARTSRSKSPEAPNREEVS